MSGKNIIIPVSVIVLAICILIGTLSISGALNNLQNTSQHQYILDQNQNIKYELIVENGWMYLIDTSNGQVWSKLADNLESSWEVQKHYSEQ